MHREQLLCYNCRGVEELQMQLAKLSVNTNAMLSWHWCWIMAAAYVEVNLHWPPGSTLQVRLKSAI
jgi:hypothetical protein